MKAVVLASSFFLVSVLAMTKVLMMTTEGSPLKMTGGELKVSTLVGGMTFLLGIISLIGMIALEVWTKSKKLGRFTTVVGVLTLILIVIMLT